MAVENHFAAQLRLKKGFCHQEYKKSSRGEVEGIKVTYVEWLFQHNPSGLGLNFEVFQVVGVVGRAECVHNRPIVVGIFVRGGHAKDVGSDAGILLNVLDVFLEAFNEKFRLANESTAAWAAYLSIKEWRVVVHIGDFDGE